MAEIKNTWGKRALAGFGALALASAGLLGGSTAASAATEFGNIDLDAKGSINIHKHKHQNGTDAVQNPDGSGTAIPSDGIDGVEFTAFPITNVDLKTSGGWDQLQGVTLGSACELPADLTKGAEVAEVVTGSAGTAGQAKISDLPVGAYLLCETYAPPEVVDRALPFIVTIPLPHNNGWLYDVYVYPKNGTSSIEKSIDDQKNQGLTLGSVVKFPVKTDIPSFGTDTELSNYIITDTLDARLGSVGVTSVTIDGVDVPEAYYTKSTVGQKVTVEFTTEGRAWLKAEKAEKQVITTFQGTVIAIGDGAITNEATVFVNDPKNGLTSKPVTTNWGDVKILKTDESKPAKGLEGAEFEIYAAANPYATTCDKEFVGGKLSVGTQGEKFTSDANGHINIAGLFVSDSVNEAVNAEFRCYVVKETKAPAGFVTPQGDAALTAVSVTKGLTNGFDVTITNTQQDVPELPLTGANGQMVMVIGGSALLLIAGGVVMLNRRRSANEQQN